MTLVINVDRGFQVAAAVPPSDEHGVDRFGALRRDRGSGQLNVDGLGDDIREHCLVVGR
ncbi:hypothetical protein BN970_03541 [Mycolicibacterium conceptionense]|uniref:Uncharacterized protein n=1 Tax=Mycolicibacterium conceptionense TaxID=451644 RepID=A0A0U1DJ17_9MYCO|nr:hypothetical protein [Mycolicibacterium conceptionense]CQD16600.1 hypothetical protein BN970_03541 [Mycolicibacterium conceptionense]